jgi:predicted O-linked N-acetylglucosamine transferase (SPINDLY family)
VLGIYNTPERHKNSKPDESGRGKIGILAKVMRFRKKGFAMTVVKSFTKERSFQLFIFPEKRLS